MQGILAHTLAKLYHKLARNCGAVHDSSDTFFFALQDEGTKDEAAQENGTRYKLRIGDDSSFSDLADTKQRITMANNCLDAGWEVAGWDLYYWHAIEFTNKAFANEFVVVARS